MRLSFEEFLREKTSDYAGDFSRSEVIDLFNEWSSQQPEDEVEVWCGCGDKLSKRSDGFYWCLGCDHGVEILAKHKERR